MKRAIITASFGTTHSDAWKRCIKPVEDAVRAAFPGYTMLPAYTSAIVRGRLKERGIDLLSPEEAIGELSGKGVSEIYILPTHLLPGDEYEKLQSAIALFPQIHTRLARPLLCGDEDFKAVLNALSALHPQTPAEGLVLMGHGSTHPRNALYAQMNGYIRANYAGHIFTATVEAEPGLDDALAYMRERDVKRVTLTPLLLVVGDHAKNDMAGEDGSWLCAFRKAGFEAEAVVKGLGEYPEIIQIYNRRLREILP